MGCKLCKVNRVAPAPVEPTPAPGLPAPSPLSSVPSNRSIHMYGNLSWSDTSSFSSSESSIPSLEPPLQSTSRFLPVTRSTPPESIDAIEPDNNTQPSRCDSDSNTSPVQLKSEDEPCSDSTKSPLALDPGPLNPDQSLSEPPSPTALAADLDPIPTIIVEEAPTGPRKTFGHDSFTVPVSIVLYPARPPRRLEVSTSESGDALPYEYLHSETEKCSSPYLRDAS